MIVTIRREDNKLSPRWLHSRGRGIKRSKLVTQLESNKPIIPGRQRAKRRPPVERACEVCGQQFRVWQSSLDRGIGRFCGRDCRGASQQKRVERTCNQCGVTFWVKSSVVEKGGGHFCGRPCLARHQSITLIGRDGRPGLRIPLEEKFWTRVDRPDDPDACWQWTGYVARDGYGRLTINLIPILAHRISYEINNGPIPKGLFVLHHCDNPRCVRPDHLFLGDQEKNMHDMIEKGRAGWQRDGDDAWRRLTASQVREIRQECRNGAGQRVLGERFGVSQATISDIVCGRTWKHLS